MSAQGLPIVFTVRTKSQGGAFPDKAEKEALVLLNAGLRLGRGVLGRGDFVTGEGDSRFDLEEGYLADPRVVT